MGKRRVLACLVCAALMQAPALFSQETILHSYQRHFVRAGLSAKTAVLKDAATDEKAPEFIGPLYEFALQFALQYAEILRDDPEMISLVSAAARGAVSSGNRASLDTLWKLFSGYRDSHTRAEILGALSVLGKGNKNLVENINRYLASLNQRQRSENKPDYPIVSACIAALARLGDSASYPVLFSAMITDYPASIVREAAAALDAIPGNYKQFLLDIILKSTPAEKLAAFRAATSSPRFTLADQGQFAETALEHGLSAFPSGGADNTALSELRYASIKILARLQWTRASPLVIRHFNRVQADVQQAAAPKERLIEAIGCLGAMGTSEAALALALQLGLLNAHIEKNGSCDEDITLAVVRALGTIGDKSAFDYLLYMSYLSYPERIQIAAKEALSRLKW